MSREAEASRAAAPLDRALVFLRCLSFRPGQFPMEFIAYDSPDPATGLVIARPANTPFCTALIGHSAELRRRSDERKP